jgi:hypothetical protein
MAKQLVPVDNFKPITLNPNLVKPTLLGEGIVKTSVDDPTTLPTESIPDKYANGVITIPTGKNLSAKQLEYQAAEDQTLVGNITKGLWNTAISFGTGVAATPGHLMNLGTFFTNNPSARLGDSWLDIVDSTKEGSSAKLYLTENDESGNVWGKLTSSAYWGSTVADTVGNALSFFVPGAALKAANIGGKVTRLLKAGNLEKPTALAGIINSASTVTANTLIESLAEGRDSYKNIKDALERERSLGLNSYSDEKIENLSSAGATSVSRGNIVPLLISNLIFDKLFFSGASTLGRRSAEEVVEASVTNSAKKLTTSILDGFKISSPKELIGNWGGFKGSPKGFWYRNMLVGAGVEGFWEENLQSALQRTVQERALLGQETELTSIATITDILNKSYGDGFDDEQLEAVVLGGLLGFGMSVPSTISDIKSYNEQYVGREAYTPSRLARALGRQSKPKVDGLISAVTGIRTGGIGSLSPEQFNEAFINEKGKLDEEKLAKALSQEENEAIRYTAKKLYSYKDREVQLANATEENKAALLKQFAAEDILDSMMPLLMHEQGGEIFSQIVDEMVNNKAKSLQEKTGIKTSLAENKQYAESLKQLGQQLNKTALRTVKNHNNIIPNYGIVKEADKLDKVMYDQALLHKRIITAVHEDLLKEKLSSEEGALKALKDRAYQIEQTIKSFEAEQDDLVKLKEERDELDTKTLPKLRNKDAVNVILSEIPTTVDAEGNVTKTSIEEARKVLNERKAEASARLKEINERLNSTESKNLLKELDKRKKDFEIAKDAIEELTLKADETKNTLGGTYVPEKYTDDNFIAAFSGRTFKGISDLNEALFDPEFVDEDFKNYVRGKRQQEAKFEKQQDLKKIKSKFFKTLFDRATIGADTIEVTVLDAEGKPVKEKRNFYYSAKFRIKVLNDSRSNFEYRKLTSNNKPIFAGENMRLVAHEPATDTAPEHLVFKEENYIVNNEGNIEVGPEILYKFYADGKLELVGGGRVLSSYEQFEYEVSSESLSKITPDSDIKILDQTKFDSEIEEHQAYVLKTALEAQYKTFTSEKQYTKKSNPVIFDNLATRVLQQVISNLNPALTAGQAASEVNAFRLLGDEIVAINKILPDINSVSQAAIAKLNKKGFTKAAELIQKKDVDSLIAYLDELKQNFDLVQDDFNKAYQDINNFLGKTILDQTGVIQNTLKQLDTLNNEVMVAALKYNEAITELKSLSNSILPEPMMQMFLDKYKVRFDKESDRKALRRFIEVMASGKPNNELFSDLLDLATDETLNNSAFVSRLYDELDSESFDETKFLDDLGGFDFNKFKAALTTQEEAIGLVTNKLVDFRKAYDKSVESVKAFANVHNTILKFFNPKVMPMANKIFSQKVIMAYQLYTGQDGAGVSNYADPMTDERAVYDARYRLHRPKLQPGYGLLRTAGNFADFFERFKYVLADLYNIPADQVSKTLKDKINDGSFTFEAIEKFLIENNRTDDLPLLDQWRYYAFIQNEDVAKRGLGAAYVTVNNVNTLPDFVKEQVRFYVPSEDKLMTIAEIDAAKIDKSKITDIKAVIVRNPTKFKNNPQDPKSYFLEPDYQNKVVYMSIRDYSKNTTESIIEEFDVRGISDVNTKVAKELSLHNSFRDGILKETAVTTAHAFGFKSPGALVDFNKESYVEVMDALEEGTELSKDLFEFPVYKTPEINEQQAVTNLAKYGANLPSGFMFLKTNGSLTLVKPKTLAEAGKTNQIFSLMQALVSDDVSVTDKKAIYNYLKAALRLRKANAAKDSYYIRLDVDNTTGKLKLIEFSDYSITGDLIKSGSSSDLSLLQAKLSQLNHNISSSKFSKNAPFTEYISYNATTKELKTKQHKTYLNYLFNPDNGTSSKAQLFDYAKIRGVNKMARPFVVPRRDAYAYLKSPEVVKVTVAKATKSSVKTSLNPLLATRTSQVSEITVATPKLETQKTSTYSDAISDGKFIITINFSSAKFSFFSDVKTLSNGLGENEMVVTLNTNDFLTKNNTFVNILGVTSDNKFIVRELTTTPSNEAVTQKVITLEELNNLVSSETLTNSFGAKLNNSGQALTTIVKLHEQKDAENLAAAAKAAQQPKQSTKPTQQQTTPTINEGDVVVNRKNVRGTVVKIEDANRVRVRTSNGKFANWNIANITVVSKASTTQSDIDDQSVTTEVPKLFEGMVLKNTSGTTYTVVSVNGEFRLKNNNTGKILNAPEATITNKIQKGALIETESTTPQVETSPQPATVDVISDEDFNNFVDNNTVSADILNSIADKVITQTQLSPREYAIYSARITDIENILKSKAPTQPITPTSTEQDVPPAAPEVITPEPLVEESTPVEVVEQETFASDITIEEDVPTQESIIDGVLKGTITDEDAVNQLVDIGLSQDEAIDLITEATTTTSETVAEDESTTSTEPEITAKSEEEVDKAIADTLTAEEIDEVAAEENKTSGEVIAEVKNGVLSALKDVNFSVSRKVQSLITKVLKALLSIALFVNLSSSALVPVPVNTNNTLTQVAESTAVNTPTNIINNSSSVIFSNTATYGQPTEPSYKQLTNEGKAYYLQEIKNKKPFILVDKPTATAYVYSSNGSLVKSFPVLLGSEVGDGKNVYGKVKLTTAGRFILSDYINDDDRKLYKNKIFFLSGASPVAIHITYPGELAERTRRLNTPTVEDNRVSWGCINVSEENFDKFISPNIGVGSVIIVTKDFQKSSIQLLQGEQSVQSIIEDCGI